MIYKGFKRTYDVILSLFGIIVLSPIFLMVGVAIKLDSKGPIIFKQIRIGKDGREFYIYKFRSMNVDSEKDGVYERKNDVRVTRIGSFIRKLSIDELPQFFNIIKGDMSIIGPRPTLSYHPWKYEDYTEVQLRRFDLRPGVTGWAQVNGRKTVEWNRRIEYDLEYIQNISFRFDLKIIVKTFTKVIFMRDNLNISETVENKGNL